MRDYTKLRAFRDSDELVFAVYDITSDFPPSEKYGLQAQIRRAALSVPTNIVEGSSRVSKVEYCRFLEIALGSSRECSYLLGVAARLRLLPGDSAIAGQYAALCATLAAVLLSLRKLSD